MNEISNIRKYVTELGKTLIGAMKVQFPVYVIHLSYETKENDPFYPIDRAIMHYIRLQPKPNIQYLAWLLGMEFGLISHRKDVLIEDGMLRLNKDKDNEDDWKYEITREGESRYFIENDERPEITVNNDLVVDGKTLNLLPEGMYQDKRQIAYRYDKNTVKQPHKPLISITDDVSVKRLIKKIEKLSEDKKIKYGLEKESSNFEVVGCTPKYINDMCLVFCRDKEKKISKDVFFDKEFVSIESLEDGLDKFLFTIRDGEILSNGGYTKQSEDEAKKNITNFYPKDSIADIFKKRYSLDSVFENDYSYSNNNFYPLSFNLTSNLLSRSENKRQVITDARKGLLEMQVKQGGVFCIKAEIDDSLFKLLDIDAKIDKWKNENGRIEYNFVDEELSYSYNWRKNLLLLDRMSELEEIDISRFIKKD